MRRGSFHLLILAGAALAAVPAAAQGAGGEDLFTPPALDSSLFSDRPAEGQPAVAVPLVAPLRHRGLQASGERRLGDDLARVGRGLPGGRGRSLSPGPVLGNRHPTAFDRYVEEIEDRIRSARRRLDG
jgi:hypothetical protein